MSTSPARSRRVYFLLAIIISGCASSVQVPAQEPKLRTTLQGDSEAVTSLAFSEDGKALASGGLDKTVRLWDAAQGKSKAEPKSFVGFPQVAGGPGGKLVALEDFGNDLRIWDIAASKVLVTLVGHTKPVYRAKLSGDGRRVATAGDGTIRVWDTANGQQLATLKGHNGATALALSRDGKFIAAGGLDDRIRIWDAAGGEPRTVIAWHSDWAQSYPMALAFSPDGQSLASGHYDIPRLWHVPSGKVRFTLQGHEQHIRAVAFSADGKLLATGGTQGKVKLWAALVGHELATLTAHKSGVLAVAFSPDGKTLASGGMDKTIKLWDISSLD